jgi:hypothetical protein
MVLKVKREGFYSKPRKSPRHAYIDPNARGTGYIILYAYHIYMAVRHQTPYRGQGLWSRVYGIPGLGSHKVTRSTISPGSHGHLGYHGSFISPICLTHGLRVTRPPSPATSQPITRVTGSPNHQGHRSPDHPDTRITRVTKHQGHPHPGHQGHSGHPGHRVTRPTITQTPGSPSTQITHHHHHHQGHGSSPGSSPWIGSSH